MFTLTRGRIAAVAAAAVLPVALLSLVETPAAAASIGKLDVLPHTGLSNTSNAPTVQTYGFCPAGTEFWQFEMTGPGVLAGDGVINGNNSHTDSNPERNADGYTFLFASRFTDVFTARNIQEPSGTYDLFMTCYDTNLQPTGELTGQVDFTHTAGQPQFVSSYEMHPVGEATATTLTETPLDPIAAGGSTTLTATVTPEASGTVQFKRNGLALGSPVTVSAGTASLTTQLPAGTSNLTAAFVSSNSATYSDSTSETDPYVVLGPAAITGKVRVGSTVTCAATGGATMTYKWISAGTTTSVTTKSVKIPSAWYNKGLACTAASSKDGRTVSRTSAAKTVAIGPALKNTRLPVASGIAKVGKTLTCQPGTWSPQTTSFAYRWLRDGRAITAKTAKTYLLVRADKGHKVGCQVTAKLAGYQNGVAKSAARLVG